MSITNALKITLPPEFWEKTEEGRYLGTIEIGGRNFHVEAVEVEPIGDTPRTGWASMCASKHTSVTGFDTTLDTLYELSGADSVLETMEIAGKPHLVFMTPYGA
jgi:hypothetical protein